ncbi:MAG TPA: DUF222 domain-containing protein [Nakamurella sp.]|nr:DUF222 domain-containing protein [Nakamurella sp.]
MSVQASDLLAVSANVGRPCDGWPDDAESHRPPDPAVGDDRARARAECNSDLARHLASIPEPPDSAEPPPVTVLDFAEEAFTGGPDAAAAIVAGADPGAGSAVLLGMLDPALVTPASMVGVIAATEKLASWVQALQHRWLAAFTVPGVAATRQGLLTYAGAPGQPLHRAAQAAARSEADADGAVDARGHARSRIGGTGRGEPDLPFSGPAVHGDADTDRVIDEAAFTVAAAEVSAALHFSPVTAQRRVRQALDFTMDLPGTLQALSLGRIDRGRALTILDRTQNLPADLRRRVETAVLPKATSRTPGQLRGIVDRAVISVDPAAAKKRQIKAREERHVTVRPNRDGMSTFIAEIAAEHAGVAFSVLDRVATTLHRRADENRRIGAVRADVFSDIFDQLATQGTVDLRATIDGRAVITHDPLRCSWINDTATIAGRFDPDTPLIDPHAGNTHNRDADPDTTADTTADTPLTDPHAGNTHSRDTDPDTTADTPLTDPHAGNTHSRDTDADTTADTTADTPLTDPHADGKPDDNVDSPGDPDRRRGPATPGPSDPADGADSTDIPAAPDDDPRRGTAAPDPDSAAPGADSTDIPAAPDDALRRGTAAPDPESAAPGADSTDTAAAPDDDPRRGTAAPDPVSPQREDRPIGRPFVFPTQQGRLTHLNVTIAATTLAGLDELPGELDGYGPIPADLCRALAVSAASITAVGVDPTCGTALDVGRTIYRPRLSHRDHVTQRDRTCRFPGCRQPARRCQIDHSEEFCDGGATCPCNLACLCKFHHDLKTTGLWDAQQHPDASITWTSPTGRTYRTQTPEWPVAAPKDHPGQHTSTVTDAEAGDTNAAPQHAVPATVASEEPPF